MGRTDHTNTVNDPSQHDSPILGLQPQTPKKEGIE